MRARVILLGASNVTRGISTVVETLRLLLGSPLEIFAAIGHGRSYGMNSTVLVRTLPGILDCGIWGSLATSHERNPQLPTYALITDIGNDIMYGAPPQVLTDWIGECIDRLRALGVESGRDGQCAGGIAMTTVPIEGIRALHRWQYTMVKSVLFPTRKLSFDEARHRAEELDRMLRELAQQRAVKTIEPRCEWYGFDPIHISMKHWPSAWRDLLAHALHCDQPSGLANTSLTRWLRLRLMRPEHWWILGIEGRKAQPAGRLPDGTMLSFF